MIVSALYEEIREVVEHLEDKTTLQGFRFEVCQGLLHGTVPVITAVIGSGKVNAAIHTSMLIERFHPEEVIGLGIAVGIASYLHLGDLVCVHRAVQYDLDLQRFGFPRGGINGSLPAIIESTYTMDGVCSEMVVTAGTADRFLTREFAADNRWLVDELQVHIGDMESYAVLAAAHEAAIPCLFFRVISDTLAGERPKRFPIFLHRASSQLYEVLLRYTQ